MAENTNDKNLETKEPKIYEIGYLLAPFIPQDNLAEAVTKSIKTPIDSLGGIITSEMNPSMIRLAYTVRKTLANKINKFNDAYFGAIRFKLSPDQTKNLKKSFDSEENLIRYLIINLPAGSEIMAIPRRVSNMGHRRDEQPFVIERITKPEETDEVKPEMTKEDIDKEIESLLVEPAN